MRTRSAAQRRRSANPDTAPSEIPAIWPGVKSSLVAAAAEVSVLVGVDSGTPVCVGVSSEEDGVDRTEVGVDVTSFSSSVLVDADVGVLITTSVVLGVLLLVGLAVAAAEVVLVTVIWPKVVAAIAGGGAASVAWGTKLPENFVE